MAIAMFTMRIHGHALVWHRQLPSWLTPALSRREVERALASHIETLVGRYAGSVQAWDVVNEAIADGGGLRDTYSSAPAERGTSPRRSGGPTSPIPPRASTTTTTTPRARGGGRTPCTPSSGGSSTTASRSTASGSRCISG